MPRAGAFLVPGRSSVTTLEEHHISEPRINDRIRVAEVRLVGPNGEQVGIVRVEDALRLAQDADLDLVEVAPDARPPVVKIMDYGKFKYEADMKAREARRNQTNTVLKEIRFRLKIDPHDYATKKGHVERFLKGGDKVKVMIMFRGREQSRPEMGVRLLQRLADDVTELGFIESMPKQDGRNMIMVLGPTKKKADQRSEQRRAQAAAKPAEAAAPQQPAAAPADEQAAGAAPTTAPAAAPVPAAAPAPAAAAPAAAAPAAAAPARAVPSAARPAAAPASTPRP
ncbi:translation initiation factor IF-3, partial [Cellulomonas sp. SG140]|uniref:translation initiation factor IF-3 n=1 Tax=Cellulomonas sp. SG140 TaxID=2976536 RepID=UPI0021E84F94